VTNATCRRPGQQAGVVPVAANRWRHVPGVGNARLRRPREVIRGGVARGHRMAVPAAVDAYAVAGRDLGSRARDCRRVPAAGVLVGVPA
jgi:hypothetical protein